MVISSPSRQPAHDTPYQRIKNSRVGRLVRENKVVTGLGAAGAAIVLAGGSVQSEAVANFARYAVVPAVGGGAALLGAAAVHDAVVNDLGTHNVRAAAKIGIGTTMALGGTQMVGLAYDIPILDEALTGVVEAAFDNGQAILGAGLVGGGIAAGRFAAGRFTEAFQNSDRRAVNLALGTGAGVASATALLGGGELIGRNFAVPGLDRALTSTVEFLSQTPAASVVGGVAMAGGAGVLATEAVRNFRNGGNDFLTVAEGMGAVTGALGGVQLAGHGLGLAATQGLLTDHADTLAGVAVAGFGAALARVSGRDALAHGVRPLNSLGLAAGAAMIPAGVGLTAHTLGLVGAAEFAGRGAAVGGGAGLGLAAFAFGKKAVESARAGRPATAAVQGVMSATSAVGGLYAIGEGLGIEAISRLGGKVAEVTVEPLFEHVLAPTAEFLFENPVAGAVVLAVGVGGYLYWKYRQQQQEAAEAAAAAPGAQPAPPAELPTAG